MPSVLDLLEVYGDVTNNSPSLLQGKSYPSQLKKQVPSAKPVDLMTSHTQHQLG